MQSLQGSLQLHYPTKKRAKSQSVPPRVDFNGWGVRRASDLIKKSGLSDWQIAEATQLTPSTVAHIRFQDTKQPQFGTLAALFWYLGE